MKLSQIPEVIMTLGFPLGNDEQSSLCHVIREEHSYSQGLEEAGF